MPGVRGCVALQKTGAPLPQLPINRARQRMAGFQSHTCPVSKHLPVNISVNRLAQCSTADSPAQFDQFAVFLSHFEFVKRLVAAVF